MTRLSHDPQRCAPEGHDTLLESPPYRAELATLPHTDPLNAAKPECNFSKESGHPRVQEAALVATVLLCVVDQGAPPSQACSSFSGCLFCSWRHPYREAAPLSLHPLRSVAP